MPTRAWCWIWERTALSVRQMKSFTIRAFRNFISASDGSLSNRRRSNDTNNTGSYFGIGVGRRLCLHVIRDDTHLWRYADCQPGARRIYHHGGLYFILAIQTAACGSDRLNGSDHAGDVPLGVLYYKVLFASRADNPRFTDITVLVTFASALVIEGLLAYFFTGIYRSTNPNMPNTSDWTVLCSTEPGLCHAIISIVLSSVVISALYPGRKCNSGHHAKS